MLYGEFHFINSKCDPVKDRRNIKPKLHTTLLDEISQILNNKMELELKTFEKIPEKVTGVIWDGTPDMAKLINHNISDDYFIILISDVWYIKDYTNGSFTPIMIGNLIDVSYRVPKVFSGTLYREIR